MVKYNARDFNHWGRCGHKSANYVSCKFGKLGTSVGCRCILVYMLILNAATCVVSLCIMVLSSNLVGRPTNDWFQRRMPVFLVGLWDKTANLSASYKIKFLYITHMLVEFAVNVCWSCCNWGQKGAKLSLNLVMAHKFEFSNGLWAKWHWGFVLLDKSEAFNSQRRGKSKFLDYCIYFFICYFRKKIVVKLFVLKTIMIE